uniref:hypothetical protein n=1 Tax=Acetatifactor sp. TaxID=1872090 RepID=UPI004056D818
MKFVKSISLFFVYPMIMFGIGFFVGVQSMHYFYPGESDGQIIREESLTRTSEGNKGNSSSEEVNDVETDNHAVKTELNSEKEVDGTANVQFEAAAEVAVSMETLSVDTEYVLEETDVVNGSVVETVWKLPDKYIGLNREQFLEAMDAYEQFPPLSEIERGFVSLEVLSFSRERVVVQMNYQYVQPSTSFYLAVYNNEVVVYLEDMETIYINTGIELSELPEKIQQEIMQMIWIEDEESLYQFLESYSS